MIIFSIELAHKIRVSRTWAACRLHRKDVSPLSSSTRLWKENTKKRKKTPNTL
jgi:hypothetical protein